MIKLFIYNREMIGLGVGMFVLLCFSFFLIICLGNDFKVYLCV